MIEFQADCGHVIHAAETAAGRIVKCAYCGREVEVPPPPGQGRDPLFEELDLDALARNEGHRTVTGLSIKGEPTTARAPAATVIRERQPQHPVKPLLIAGYSMVALVVLIVVSRSVVRHAGNRPSAPASGALQDLDPSMSKSEATPPPAPGEQASLAAGRPRPPDQPAAKPRSEPASARAGLLGQTLPKGQQGVYVHALSDHVQVFVAPQHDAADAAPSIAFLAGSANRPQMCSPGSYRITVRMPADDLQVPASVQNWLRGPQAAGQPAVPSGLLQRDASVGTHLLQDADGTRWLARYYDLQIHPLEWRLVTALFCIPVPLDQLRTSLPNSVRYGLDRDDAHDALSFEGVAESDHEVLLDILSRIGQVFYTHADGREQILEIGLVDGLLQSRAAPAGSDSRIFQPGEVASPDQRASTLSPWGTPRGQETADANQPALRPGTGEAGARSIAGQASGPWGPRKGSQPAGTTTAAGSALTHRVEKLREILDQGSDLDASELRTDLRSSGWSQAQASERLAWIDLLTPDIAGSLLEDLGEAMLADPDLAVRHALLDALVSTGRKDALTFIDRRLTALAALPAADAAAPGDEQATLIRAREQLLAGNRGPTSRNPWGRR